MQKNIDALFDLEFSDKVKIHGSLDLHDCINTENYNKLNTGVLVFEPSKDSWEALMENYKNAPQRSNWMSDQDLIADTFDQTTAIIPEKTATMFVSFC